MMQHHAVAYDELFVANQLEQIEPTLAQLWLIAKGERGAKGITELDPLVARTLTLSLPDAVATVTSSDPPRSGRSTFIARSSPPPNELIFQGRAARR